jgi:hypothetical protein
MIEIAIKVQNLSKCYDNPRDRLKQLVARPLQGLAWYATIKLTNLCAWSKCFKRGYQLKSGQGDECYRGILFFASYIIYPVLSW